MAGESFIVTFIPYLINRGQSEIAPENSLERIQRWYRQQLADVSDYLPIEIEDIKYSENSGVIAIKATFVENVDDDLIDINDIAAGLIDPDADGNHPIYFHVEQSGEDIEYLVSGDDMALVSELDPEEAASIEALFN